jgi:hypothetical protein
MDAARTAVTAAALVALGAGTWAQDEAAGGAPSERRTRFRVALDGGAVLGDVRFGQSKTVREFAEDGSLEAAYQAPAGAGFDGSLQFNFTPRFGVAASLSLANRDDAASYSAALPHPLYLNQFRNKTGELPGLDYRERAFHLDLVYSAGTGSLGFHAFAGASFFKVEADLIDQVRYRHEYPYDTDQVTVTDVPTLAAEDSPMGFNVGAAVDYRLGRSFGVGAQGRFSRARASLAPSVELDAGGFQVSGGLRLYF